MSNTLDETLHEVLITVMGGNQQYRYSIELQGAKAKLRSLILSEAHEIGLEAIGKDVELRGDAPDFIDKPDEWLESGISPSFTYLNMRAVARELQKKQRLRLSKLTGVKSDE